MKCLVLTLAKKFSPCIVGCFLFTPVVGAADVGFSGWRVAQTRSLGDIPALRPIPVCLRRSGAQWTAALEPREGDSCDRIVYADRFGKTFYVEDSPSGLSIALHAAGVIEMLARLGEQEAARRETERVERYRAAFRNATSLDAIAAFEQLYAGNDPEGFIPQLAPTKHSLQLGIYRQRFASLTTSDEFIAFISDYRNNDPEGLVPRARLRLAEKERRAAETASQVENARRLAEKTATILDLEQRIRDCRRQVQYAQSTIQRENRIGAVSGYVDKLAMRRAGEVIVACEVRLQADIPAYIKLGGSKSIEALR